MGGKASADPDNGQELSRDLHLPGEQVTSPIQPGADRKAGLVYCTPALVGSNGSTRLLGRGYKSESAFIKVPCT